MPTHVIVASWVLIFATLLPLLKKEAWWIRVFDFPRSQITALALVCIGVMLWTYEASSIFGTITLGVMVTCTAYQSWQLTTYTGLRRLQSLPFESTDESCRVRLLIANVLMSNHDVNEYLDLIEKCDPDIIALAEPDHYWEENLRGIEKNYPHSIKCPLENTYGMLLYSRLPFSEEEVRFRVEEDVPSFRALVELRCGEVFELHCVHPRPPHVGVDTEHRDAELVLVAAEVKDSPSAVIVTGDLNDVAWSHTTRLFLRISGLLDPRVGRAFCNTFHARYPLFRWPLDHLFHSRAFRLVKLERLPATASDHFPVLVELSYEPEKRAEQDKPELFESDVEEAVEKVDNVADEALEVPAEGLDARTLR